MRASVHVICGREAAPGIALAGFAPFIAESGVEAAAVLDRIAGEPARGGIVLIEQALHDSLPAATRKQLRQEGVPITMPFPGPSALREGSAPEHELLEILRRAIGYRVRLQ